MSTPTRFPPKQKKYEFGGRKLAIAFCESDESKHFVGSRNFLPIEACLHCYCTTLSSIADTELGHDTKSENQGKPQQAKPLVIMGQSPSRDGSKEAPSRIRNHPSDGSKETSKIGADKSTIVGRAKAKEMMRENTSNPTIDGNGKLSTSGYENDVFSSNAKDALAFAMSLAQESSPNTASKKFMQAAGEASLDPGKEPETNEISIERLRDIINEHPDEFWRSEANGSKANKKETSISEKTSNAYPIHFEQKSPSESTEKSEDEAGSDSEHVSKRRKLHHPTSSPLSSPQKETTKRNDSQVFTTHDRQVLSAVQSLLEDSLQNLPSGNFSRSLLEQLKAKQSSAMEADTEGIGIQEMAHEVTLSFAEDLSDLLKAMNNARSCIQDEENASELPKENSLSSSKPTTVETSLLCDEQDIVQLREDKTTNDKSENDDILGISQHKKDLPQHLLCDENEEALFGKPIDEETSTSSDNDLLFAQKVALIRETKRLIRAKTMVLTKRRLGIQTEEDLSLVI